MNMCLGAGRYLAIGWLCSSVYACGGSSTPQGDANAAVGAPAGAPIAGVGGAPGTNPQLTTPSGATVSAGAAASTMATTAGTGAMTTGTGGTMGSASASATEGGSPSTTGVPGAVPQDVGMRSSWTSFGGDLAHTRSSPMESMLSTTNVSMLKAAFDIQAPGVTSTPTIYHGVMYWADWGGNVHATHLADQKDAWTQSRSENMGGYTGSPFVTEKAVYVANRNGLVTAFDRMTGMQLWETKLDAGVHTHVWSSPVVAEADNVLVVGIGGWGTRDNGVALPRSQLEMFRGSVEGLDATTGDKLWSLPTTPAPNGAGVSVWSSAAIDPTRKLAFIGTGNNYYKPVSELSDSLLAIDYTTGTLAWHSQFTMNDAWTVGTVLEGGVDGDVGATPNLFAIDGRDVVGVGDKRGVYHVRDRMTGDVVWDKKLTQGGYQGGVMAPASYLDGVIYVVSNNDTINSTAFALSATDGSIIWEKDLTDPTFGGGAVGNGVVYVGDQAGNMWALDAKDGSELWQQRLAQGRGGGFSLVDGMLFTGYGFHFSESRKEPLSGGVVGYSLTGTITMPQGTTQMSDCIADTPLTNEPTFTNVYQGVLCPNGCTKVCHSSSMEAGLQLDVKSIAYETMVNMPARGDACKSSGQPLVTPGDPSASLLYGKLSAMPICGIPMPPSAMSGNTPVTAEQLKVLSDWIMAGAPND